MQNLLTRHDGRLLTS